MSMLDLVLEYIYLSNQWAKFMGYVVVIASNRHISLARVLIECETQMHKCEVNVIRKKMPCQSFYEKGTKVYVKNDSSITPFSSFIREWKELVCG